MWTERMRDLFHTRRLRMLASNGAELAVACGLCVGIDRIFHNPYCGLLFRCRCTWPWAGGAAHCNIHHASGPRCPWCNVRNTPLRGLAWAISDNFSVFLMLVAYMATWAMQHWKAARTSPASDRIRLLESPEKCLPYYTAARRFGVRALAAALTFLLLGLVLGIIFVVGTGYPCFLWIAPLGPNGTQCGFPVEPGEL